MRRDPVEGVVWITFDKKFVKRETQVPGDSFWMDLPRFSEVQSFSDTIEIEYSPSNRRYWAFCAIAYAALIIVSCVIAVLFFAVPKPSAAPTTQQSVSVPQKPANRPVSRPAPRKKNTSSGSSQPVITINSTPAVQPAAPAVAKVPQAPKAGGTAVPVSSAGQRAGSSAQAAAVTQPQAAPQKTTVLSVPSAPANTQPAENKTIEDRQINSSTITIDLSPQNTVRPVRKSTPPRRTKRKIQIMN